MGKGSALGDKFSETDIQKNNELSAELDNPNPLRRMHAIISLSQTDIWDEKLLDKLRFIAKADPDQNVRGAAEKAIRPFHSLIKKTERDRSSIGNSIQESGNIWDIWIGIGLFFGINLVLYFLFSWGGWDLTFIGFTPFIINIGMIIYFAFTRRNIAYGLMLGFGISLFLALFAGVFLMLSCFMPPKP
jgi:hypothetical protein